MLEKQQKRKKRHQRIRSRIFGTAQRPRLYVFKSGKYIYLQLIDDEKSKIIASIKTGLNVQKAKEAGIEIAKKAKGLKIESIIFDRGGYKYHGRVKAVADGAREQGLKF